MIREDGFKQCRGCGEWKPVAEFYSCKTPRSDGYTSHCKPCDKARVIAYQKAHPEKKAAQDRKRQQKPHVKAQRSQRAKERKAEQLAIDAEAVRRKEKEIRGRYNETHHDEILERARIWREANLEIARERTRQSYYNHAEKNRDDSKLYKAQQRCQFKFKIDREDWLRICEAFDNRCCYCDSIENLTIEHLTPFSKNGTNEIGNVAVACRTCNDRKHAKTVEQFAPEKAIAIRRKAMLL